MFSMRGSINGSPTSENTSIISTEELHKLRIQNSDLLKQLKVAEEFIGEKESEINALEKKHKQLLEETTAKISALNNQVNLLKGDLNFEKSASETLSHKLKIREEELKAERERSIGGPMNETAVFNAESKVDEVRAEMKEMKKECFELVNHNNELLENIQRLESSLEEKIIEVDNLRKQNSELRNDLQASKEEVMVLNAEMHAIKADPKMASQGNSLFGEVIDGREKQEKEMLLLHQEKQKLKLALDNTLKLLHEHTKQENIPFDKNALNGPTLAAFKIAKDELTRCQREKDMLVEQVNVLEQAEHTRRKQVAQQEMGDFAGNRRYQELMREENIQTKQRLECRIRELEMQSRDLLNAVKYEKQRAAAIPQLERKISTLSHVISQYEKNLMPKG